MKVLCICPIGIGNYLLMYPACYTLKKHRREFELHLLALRMPINDLAAGDPLWSGVHLIDPTKEPSIGRQAAFVGTLWRERFDASLSFFPSNTWQYNLLPFIASIGSRYAFGYHVKQGASFSFLNTHLTPVDPALHDVNQNARLVSSFLGLPVEKDALVFPKLFGEKERGEAHAFLNELGGPRLFVGVHPGSSAEHGMDAKRWDPMRFGELTGRICRELGAQALIFGGRDEEKIKHVTASIIKAPVHIVEPRDLRSTSALLAQCVLLLCNDSGLMHMAACAGTPVAALFGPTDEKRNGPWGAGHVVIRKPMQGFPLWTAATAGVRAIKGGVDPIASLRALTVDDAWEVVAPWLKRFQSKP
jgi:ADP-heptose:LPS heptosyltransferase